MNSNQQTETPKCWPTIVRTSPIEQQIIDGRMYWDTIGSKDWMRLIWRNVTSPIDSQVVGHYKKDTCYFGSIDCPAFVATINAVGFITQHKSQRIFDSEVDAKYFVETHALDEYARIAT